MPIDRANTAYDPQDARQRANAAAPRQTHTDHDDGPFSARLNSRPPPKPGVSIGLLLWTIFGAALTITTVIAALIVYVRA